MNTNNLIKEIFTDIEAGKFDKANALLADNFRAVLLGKEVNRPIYMSAYRSLLQGMPDLKFDVLSVRSAGGRATATLKLSGTNSRAIPALMKGWHEMPATNTRIDGLITDLEIILKDDKIEEIRNAQHTRGLFASLLENLDMNYKKFRVN
jgi:hypothetical protein